MSQRVFLNAIFRFMDGQGKQETQWNCVDDFTKTNALVAVAPFA